MAYSNIAQLIGAINAEIIANGQEEITGPILNEILIGLTQFIEQSPLNWDKVQVESGGGDIVITDDYVGTVVFITTAPDSLSFGDNVYNEYVLINMTGTAIPLDTPSVYYKPDGTTVSAIPANSAVALLKAANDLWIQWNVSSGGGGSTQKQPLSFKVGTTVGAPVAGTSTWVNAAFENSYVVLTVNYGPVNQSDMGDGSPYSTKPSLPSTTVNIGNHTWQTGDIVSYILITP